LWVRSAGPGMAIGLATVAVAVTVAT
jgi:hypothetical protein